MRVTPEQSRRVQEICFENGIEWLVSCKLISYLPKPYLIIEDSIITYRDYGRELEHNINIEEIDADLFIRTNGTCKENQAKRLLEKLENMEDVEIYTAKEFNKISLKLKKKNEILKKARIKRKNQREELNKLNLKLQKSINLESHRKVVNFHIERNKALLSEIESLKQSSKISCNMLHQQQKSHEIVLIEVDAKQKLHKKEI